MRVACATRPSGGVTPVVVRLVLIALVLTVGCGGEQERRAASPGPVVAALQRGGHTLVVRHAIADARINEQELLRSCAYQRNLTEAGRDQARAIGRGIRALRIPVGDVRASPLCRSRDTARIAFGRTTADRDLVSPGVVGTEADDRRRARRLRTIVERGAATDANTVLVTHTGNIGAAFGEETVQEGEVLVYGRGARLVGRVRAEEWAGLAAGR